MPDANAIPVIDLGPYLAGEPGALDRAAAELRHALTEIGFYTIVNHGVPSALVHEVYRQVARFHARPLEEKLRIKLDKHNVGYLPMMGDTSDDRHDVPNEIPDPVPEPRGSAGTALHDELLQ